MKLLETTTAIVLLFSSSIALSGNKCCTTYSAAQNKWIEGLMVCSHTQDCRVDANTQGSRCKSPCGADSTGKNIEKAIKKVKIKKPHI